MKRNTGGAASVLALSVAFAMAITLWLLGGSDQARADFDDLLFDSTSVSITTVGGESSLLTVSATGVPTDSTVLQLQLGYDQSVIDVVDSSVDCAGIVDDNGSTSPSISRTASTITIACSIGGGRTVSGSSGEVLKFKFERKGAGEETANVIDWDAATNPGGTAFFDPAGHVPTTKNSVTVTGFATPSAPQNVKAEGGNKKVIVSWDKVTKDPNGNALPTGREVTSYTVHLFLKGGTSAVATTSASGTPVPLTATITGLDNGKTYFAKVTATNQDGTSDPSAASNEVNTSADALDKVQLSATSLTIGSGESRTIRATPFTESGAVAPNTTIVWSKVSGGGSVSSNGTFTAGTGPDTSVMRATATQSGTGAVRTADVTFEILSPPPPATPTPPPKNPGAVPTPPPPAKSGGVVEVITPEEGGQVSSGDGNATVSVPRGAVTDKFVAVEVAPVADNDVPPVPGALRLTTGKRTVEITFRDIDGNLLPQFRLQKSVKVTLKFDPDEASEAGGGQALKMLKYDSASEQWVALPATVDLINRTISASVRTFSLFSVGVPRPEATPTPMPTPAPSPTPEPEVVLPATGDSTPGSGLIAGLIGLGAVLVAGGSVALYRRRRVQA